MDRKQKVILGAGLGTATALGIWALTRKKEVAPPPPPPPGLATVRITVVDGTRMPIAGASVTMDGMQSITNSDGIVDFTDVQPGSYALTCSAVSYQPKSQPVTVVEGTNIFTIELSWLAPAVASITLHLINYPSEGIFYDAELDGGDSITDISIANQVVIRGPSSTTLTIRIYNESGEVIYYAQIEVTLEDGAFYAFDCDSKTLAKLTIGWSLLSLFIPSQAPYAGEFNPAAILKLANDGKTAYQFACHINCIGIKNQPHRVRFLGWTFLPPEFMAITKEPAHYRSLDSFMGMYAVEGCNVADPATDTMWESGPCRLYYLDPIWTGKWYPVEPGTYPVYAILRWGTVTEVEGDIAIRRWNAHEFGQVATLEVVLQDRFELGNFSAPASGSKGQIVTASVDVTNTGVAPGTAEVVYGASIVKIGSNWYLEKNVATITLDAGQSQRLDYIFTIPADYTRSIVDVEFTIERFAQMLLGRIDIPRS